MLFIAVVFTDLLLRAANVQHRGSTVHSASIPLFHHNVLNKTYRRPQNISIAISAVLECRIMMLNMLFWGLYDTNKSNIYSGDAFL